MRDDDIEAVTRAWTARDAIALERAVPALGLAITLADLDRLVTAGMLRLHVTEILSTILDALHGHSGIAVREVRDLGGYGKLFCLAMRDAEHVTAGVGGVESLRDTVSKVWPSLRPWSKEVSRNRERLEVWSREPAGDRVRLAIRPEAARPSADARANEQALWAQIVESPRDVALRLVLADLLLERGDVRGELIRLHAEIAQLPDGPARQQLKRRERELVELHHPWLAGEIADVTTAFTIVGGFVHSVTMTPAQVKKHAARLFRAHPIRKLVVDKLDRDADFVGPALERVRSLVLVGGSASMVPVPRPRPLQLPAVEELRVGGGWFRPVTDQRWLAELAAPRLVKLALVDCWFGSDALEALARNPSTRGLVELELVDIANDESGADAAAGAALAAIELPALQRIRLRRTWFAERWAQGISARAPRLQRLER